MQLVIGIQRKMAASRLKLAPSILAADFARLGEQVLEVERAGVDRIHIDVMDGHFVPNLSMGAEIVNSLRPVTELSIEVHLMILNPDLFLDDFAHAGADLLIVHWEANNNLHRTVDRIKSLQKKVGVAINPATPPHVLEEILPIIDQVLVMSVDPGYGNQAFINATLSKVRRVRHVIAKRNFTCDLEVDGGIDAASSLLAVEAGANVLVAGTSIFRNRAGVTSAISELRSAMDQARYQS